MKTIEAPASAHDTADRQLGLLAGIAAHVMWGLFPAVFKLVKHVPPITVLAHRVVWSAIFMTAVITWSRQWPTLWRAVRTPRVLLMLIGSTLAIGINWYTFIWAVGHNHVMQSSLGYYINPLVVMLLGAIFLHERLRPRQLLAVAIATSAVTLLVIWVGSVPWVSLSLAVSFGFYGLLRKTVAVNPSVGLTVETAILLPFTPLMMTRYAVDGSPMTLSTYVILLLIGTLTAAPLVWFAAAAKRLRLATMGFLQYITPTLQFLLATLAFHEPFARPQVVAFVLIWSALIIYAYDSVSRRTDQTVEVA